jgi:hypothetical protein
MQRSNRKLKTRRRQYRQFKGVEARSEVVARIEAGIEALVRCRKFLVALTYNFRRRSQRDGMTRRVTPCR